MFMLLKRLLRKNRKRRVEKVSNRPYLLLSEEDIEKLRNGESITFELDEYVADIIIKSDESYEKMIDGIDTAVIVEELL